MLGKVEQIKMKSSKLKFNQISTLRDSDRKIEGLPAPNKIKTLEEATPVCIAIFNFSLASVA